MWQIPVLKDKSFIPQAPVLPGTIIVCQQGETVMSPRLHEKD